MVRHDVDGAKNQLADQQKLKGERITYALYCLAWLMTDQDDKFIKFPADIKKIPSCGKFIGEYPCMALPLSSRFDNAARILADGKLSPS